MTSGSPDEITSLFSDLTFEKRLSLVAEGFCPYCEVALADRVIVWEHVRARCPCCAGLYKTANPKPFGPGWASLGGHDCPHASGAWASDEDPSRTRLEFRGKRVVMRPGQVVYLLR